jgi:hypothetical protein
MSTSTLLPAAAGLARDEQPARIRNEEKEALVLRFLRDEKWSHVSVLKLLLGVTSRQAVHKTMTALERKGLVMRHVIDTSYGRPQIVWGITTHGVGMSHADGDEIRDVRAFEASKFSLVQMGHHLDVQRVHVMASSSGWTGWTTEKLKKAGVKNPDAIAVRPDGQRVAIEVERTIKELRRYPEALVSHLRSRKNGEWDAIYYLSPTPKIRDKVRSIFEGISEVDLNGKPLKITPEHLAPFKFFTYDEKWC